MENPENKRYFFVCDNTVDKNTKEDIGTLLLETGAKIIETDPENLCRNEKLLPSDRAFVYCSLAGVKRVIKDAEKYEFGITVYPAEMRKQFRKGFGTPENLNEAIEIFINSEPRPLYILYADH